MMMMMVAAGILWLKLRENGNCLCVFLRWNKQGIEQGKTKNGSRHNLYEMQVRPQSTLGLSDGQKKKISSLVDWLNV